MPDHLGTITCYGEYRMTLCNLSANARHTWKLLASPSLPQSTATFPTPINNTLFFSTYHNIAAAA